MADLKPPAVDKTAAPAISSAPASAAAGVDASATADRAAHDVVDAWLVEHPDTPESYETVEVDDSKVSKTELPAADKPAGDAVDPAAEKPATAAASADKPATEDKPAATDPAAKPADKPADKPAAAALDLKESITIDDGVSWTREQVQTGLRQRKAYRQEAAGFQQLFGTNAADAAKNWKPILAKLAADKSRVTILETFLGDPACEKYLRECFTEYEKFVAENGKPGATDKPAENAGAKYANLDPETRQQITELSTWRAERERHDATNRLNGEMSQAQAQYPILATDRDLLNAVFDRAAKMHAADPKLGFLDAVQSMSRIIDSVQRASMSSAPASAAKPAVDVPALNSSAGATPTAGQQRTRTTGDPVEDWIAGGARAAGFE